MKKLKNCWDRLDKFNGQGWWLGLMAKKINIK